MVFDLDVPLVTGGMAGTGGVFKARPEDFDVEEVPAYDPSGEGPHLYLFVEKRGVHAKEALRRLGERFGCGAGGVGQAGVKDARAVTRQWFSVLDEVGHHAGTLVEPGDIDLGEGMSVLKVSRHHNRLKTGHLKGNRFSILIREAGPEALERAERVMEGLEGRGVPNFYGLQRFGHEGSTLEMGMALVKGGPRASRARRDRFLKRMAISAVQSWLFNRVLSQRMAQGALFEVLDGDIMTRRDSGGRFEVDDVALCQARFDGGEIVHTGPILGHKGRTASGAAGALEKACAEEVDLSPEDFSPFSKLARGTRRDNLVFPEGAEVQADPEGLRLRFTLPKGSYATVVLREVMKG